MKTQKIVSFIVYLITALTLGFVAFESMMVGVWGVPINPLNYVAVLAAMALFFGSFVCLFNFANGRMICAIALAALGTFYVPAIVSIVPANDSIISPSLYFIFLIYFAALAFSLFFPTRWKLSLPLYLAVLVITTAFIHFTYSHRIAAGEFDRPSFAFFVWKPGGSNLDVVNNYGWVNDETKSLLEQNGIRGQLERNFWRDYKHQKNCVIVLAQRKITFPKKIFYPRNGTIIYAFDGTNWISLPKNAQTYSGFATLEQDGNQTMLEQDVIGGIEGTSVFQWK
jgi:hypothetical protein